MSGILWEDLVDSVRVEEVLDALGVRTNDRRRGEYWDSCPLDSHPGADRSPSFSVNEEKLVWNCFTCGEGGSLPSLVAHIEGLNWQQSLEWLVPFSDGVPGDDIGFLNQLDRLLLAPEKPRRAREAPTLPYLMPKVLERLREAPVASVAKWGLNEETIKDFNLRYDPERVRRRGELEYVGPALVIPHFFEGNLVGYQERWLDDDRPDWVPKYTNTDDLPKGLTLFNWDRALEHAGDGPILVVESATTTMRLWQLGYVAVGTFGAAITDEQFVLLRSFTNGLILSTDNDPSYLNRKGQVVEGAGKKNLRTAIQFLDSHVPLYVIDPPDKEKGDLADIGEEEAHALIARTKPAFLAIAAT